MMKDRSDEGGKERVDVETRRRMRKCWGNDGGGGGSSLASCSVVSSFFFFFPFGAAEKGRHGREAGDHDQRSENPDPDPYFGHGPI